MRILLLLLALMVGPATVSHAEDDLAAAQKVITAQVDALGRDDAATAYSYAAPALKGVFTDPNVFMAMVKKGYAPVYRHKSFEFGKAQAAANQIAQRVTIVDAEGQAWEALYTLERQSDGSMKISGCTLIKAGQAV